ncbi:MAG TPA: flavin reductase family protein [Roseomonas sp.]|nr:flavin reductase family protein [Roseomonas sp.]
MLFDFANLTVAERYKLLTSTVVPRPIAWVVTQDAAGVVNAAPFSFFNAFSSDPAVVGVSVGGSPRGPGDKDTLANIKATGQFVVCLVSEAVSEAMNITAIDMPPELDELAEAGLTPTPSRMVKPPRIAESPVAIECETFQLVPLGGNTLVLGRVLAMEVRDDCVSDPAKLYIDSPGLGLIGRMHGRGWYARTTDRVEIPRITWSQWQARKAEKPE